MDIQTWNSTIDRFLVIGGGALMAVGVVLALLLSIFEIRADSSTGFVVSTIFGMGISLLLLAWLRRMLPISMSSSDALLDHDVAKKSQSMNQWIRNTKISMCFSLVTALLALGLCFGGVAIAFVNFNFASGTNDVGVYILLTGLALVALSGLSTLVGVVVGWMTSRATGNLLWLSIACVFPFLHAVVFATTWLITR